MLMIENMPPSVVQENKFGVLSDKYSHLPTSLLCRWMIDNGFDPVTAVETRVRKAEKQGFQKHMIRFRKSGQDIEGDSFPEIVVINSHDGSSGIQLWAGLFRIVCANGIVAASETYAKASIAHRGDIADKVITAAYRVVEDAERASIAVKDWKKIELSPMQQLDFAAEALLQRYEKLEEAPIRPRDLLQIRRSEDVNSDLWTTFNMVQEHMVRGTRGYRVNKHGNVAPRTLRGISSVARNVELNASLWQIAERYATAA